MRKKILMVTVAAAVLCFACAAYAGDVVKIGVAAMISPKETAKYYTDMLNYVGQKIGKKVEIIQKENYSEMDAMLEKNDVSVAFVCSGPYVKDHEKFGAE